MSTKPAKPADDWDGRTFCNRCGCPHEGMPNRCQQCGNVDFSLRPNVTYERGWMRKRMERHYGKPLFDTLDQFYRDQHGMEV